MRLMYQLIPGDDLLFHPVYRAVPSAQEGLTSLFGMGRGVSPPLWSPEFFFNLKNELGDESH